MNILMKFIDWRQGAANALKWYGQILSAMGRAGETPAQTEVRLFELYGGAKSAVCCDVPPDPAEFEAASAEIREFLPDFFRAWFRLDDRERCILGEFYLFPGKTTLETVMRISEILSYERSRIYELKRKALSKLSFFLFKHM